MSIRAVIFDLGGVMLESPLEVALAFEREQGLPAGSLIRVVQSGGSDGPWPRIERGEIDMDEFCRLLDAQAIELDAPFSSRGLMAVIDTFAVTCPQALACVRRLRAAGMKTAALTNIWHSAGGMTERVESLHPEFDVFVESYKVGMRKPEPRIYELVLEGLGVPAEAAIFLDDMEQNLEPAREMGMTTIKVERIDEAIEDLERLLGR